MEELEPAGTLMRTIRKILLTEYIGAIVVALLAVDAVGALINTVVKMVSYHIYASRIDAAIIDAHRMSTAYSLLETFTRIGLFLLTAYLIVRWLYPENLAPSTRSTGDRDKP